MAVLAAPFLFASEPPWALAKTNPTGKGNCALCERLKFCGKSASLRSLSCPASAAKLLDLLAVPAAEREFSALRPERRVKAGAMLPPPAPIFPRYVEAEEKA